jgi:quercetin dioxygenase-like cupin family protein
MLREINSSIRYDLQSRGTTELHALRARGLAVESGQVWATRLGDAADYWLRPGESLMLEPGQTLWLSAEHGESARIVISLTPRTAWSERAARAWHALLARLGLQRRRHGACTA